MKDIDLRSDTVTRPSQEMRAAMASAEVGDDVFCEDPTVNELQTVVALMLGQEDALFIPSGTMGNQLAIKTHTAPGNEIICEADSHIFKYECGAAGMLSGVITKCLAGDRGILTAEQVSAAINGPDIHSAPSGMIALENTHNRAGGTIYPIEIVRSVSALAHERNIPIHLDGARLFNACVATNIKPMEYGHLFDSVNVCLSKGLGAPAGSVLAGSQAFIQKARYYRKAYGGGMRQVGILAAAGLYALRNNLDKLREDHIKAHRLAEGISVCSKLSIDPRSVQTNIVIFDVKASDLNAEMVTSTLLQSGIKAIAFGPRRVRLVTHLDVSMEDIEETIRRIQQHFS